MDRPIVTDIELTLPAMLTVWPLTLSAKAVEPRELGSLREALALADAVLRDGSGAPWILTESGTILTPAYLRGMMLA